jgi:hypothetical protein
MLFDYIKILFFIFLTGSVFAQQIDSLQVKMNYINTTPQNAEVYLNNVYIGSTPVRFFNDAADTSKKNTIIIKLIGYNDFSFTFDNSDLPLYKNIALVSSNHLLNNNNIVIKNGSNLFSTPRQIAPLALSGALIIGSSFTSFYFKRLANDRYDEYTNTGDRDKLNQTKKYDIISGVALGVLQVGLVSFLYFLLIK